MTLADAGGTEQHDVLGPVDEAQCGKLLDLLLGGAGGELKVVALDRLDGGQGRELQQGLANAFSASGLLDLQH